MANTAGLIARMAWLAATHQRNLLFAPERILFPSKEIGTFLILKKLYHLIRNPNQALSQKLRRLYPNVFCAELL